MTRIQFLGAARSVTGSKHLLTADHGNVLVDCGLFQGTKALRELNWSRLPVNPAQVDDVVLTHAHLDHTGYLPRFVKNGFHGKIWCTPATAELAGIMLRDAAHIQEEDAHYANKKGYSRHHPAEPLYTTRDAERTLRLIHTRPYGETFRVGGGSIDIRFSNAGHILGSALVEVSCGTQRVLFTGDLGHPDAPIVNDPAVVSAADYVVIESTYGDRLRPQDDSMDHLATIVNETMAAGGALVIPAFALERTQDLLYMLAGLHAAGSIPDVPIFVDSPMAVQVTKVYLKHPELYDVEAAARVSGLFGETRVHYAESREASMAINGMKPPFIVVASSGMATAGRVLHHMARFLPDANSTLLLVGYQANGTRGSLLEHGASEVKIHGQIVPVRARIHRLEGLSGHADADQLLTWLQALATRPKRVFVVHGEEQSSSAFAVRIREKLGLDAYVPRLNEIVEL